ncbi:MAG: hypothetical protein E7Z85_06675 [Methanosphaera stadtmanae]|nr:hypothetical protein [Methanosphaera stadtmanae]
MKNTKKIKTTIKIDENIKEKLDKYKRYGYSKNEIITMGIILLEDSKNFETLLMNKQKEKETITEIIKLQESLKKLNDKIDKVNYTSEYYKIQEIIKQITEDEIIPREQIMHYHGVKPEPIRNEYFQEKEEKTGISKEIIKNELINKFTQTYLEDLNILID